MVDARDPVLRPRLPDSGNAAARYVVGGHHLPWADVVALMDELTAVRRYRIPAAAARRSVASATRSRVVPDSR